MSVVDRPGRALGGRALRGWRQPRCDTCGLPERWCACASLPKLAVRARVSVVMHHIEARRSTNTGRLAAAMLSGASVRLRGSREDAPSATPLGPRLVLFPSPDARALRADDGRDNLVLVVPDGTWPQARRIRQRDVLARGVESVTLPSVSPSSYALRRSSREGSLSTLEAIAAALGILEGPHVESAMREFFIEWRERALRVRAGE